MVEGSLKDCYKFLREESISNRAREICGLLGYNGRRYVAQLLPNRSPKPNEYFIINPLDFLLFKRKYTVLAVFHSHLSEDCSATEFDKAHAKNCCLPFLIYSIPEKKFGVFVPSNSEVNEKFLKKMEAAND